MKLNHDELKFSHHSIEGVELPWKCLPKLFYRSQINQALQFAAILQLAMLTGSSELARFANAADYEQTAMSGQYGYVDVVLG